MIWIRSPVTYASVVHSTCSSQAMWRTHAPTFNKWHMKKKKTLHIAMRGCGLTSLVACIDYKFCDIREKDVTIWSEIWTTNICSLVFGYIRECVTLRRLILQSLKYTIVVPRKYCAQPLTSHTQFPSNLLENITSISTTVTEDLKFFRQIWPYRCLHVRGDYSQFSQPPKIPFMTLMLVHMWYKESTPRNIRNFVQMPPIRLNLPRDILNQGNVIMKLLSILC
jgi:hypothetical protein